jgi:glyoxylase-like metal-dependent hydrolase (beta-lactamase superfamily II)
MTDPLAFSSRHFQLTQLATGVFAAIARREAGGETANAGFVDLGREVLVFDTFLLPAAARDLRRAIQFLLGKPVRYVVNSHYHVGHIGGNGVFPAEAAILTTAGTQQILQSQGETYLAQLKEELPANLQQLRRAHDQARTAESRQSLAAQATLASSLLQDLPALALRLPTLTTSGRALIHGSQRSIEFVTLGGGHTASDGFLYLPEDDILFAGDLLVKETHPSLADAHLDAWKAQLEKLLSLPFSVAVPGHGPLATKEDITALLAYFAALDDLAEQVHIRGDAALELAAMAVPAAYQDWQGGSFTHNVDRILRQLHASDGAPGGAAGDEEA